ncbi:MAG: asparagine synthase-related protein, partial [Rikenellaceae bacterium]
QHAYQTDLEKTINQVILFKASQTAQMFDNKIAFPFMDLELYKFLEHLPVRYKCQGDTAFKIARGESTSKILLKHHYHSLLPEAITSKTKQGGFAPMPIFFKEKAQRSKLADYIMQSSLTDEYLNRRYVEQFIKKYDTEVDDNSKWFWYKQNNAIKYFNLLTLAIWWEQFVKLKESTLI